MDTANDVAVKSRNAGLVDVLDRVLDKGVVVDGDIQLCVAGIELVYLKLKLLLASTAAVEKIEPIINDIRGYLPSNLEESETIQCAQRNPSSQKIENVERGLDTTEALKARVLRDDEPAPSFSNEPSGKVDIDPKKVEQGLAKLVLTLVELLRKLMEKQALRRVELGALTDKQIDSLGEAFLRLNEKMKELKEVFGLKDEDLNLDLGPLEDLM